MARRSLTTLDKLKIMVEQAVCPRCGEKLGELRNVDFDHIHALALGGADELGNISAVHKDCHRTKTTGRRGESKLSVSRDGDVQKIAKIRRATATKPRKKSTWPTGRKLQSRNDLRKKKPAR